MKNTSTGTPQTGSDTEPCFVGCFYSDACYKDTPGQGGQVMIRTPFHKQTDPAKMPGQVRDPAKMTGQVRDPAPVKAAEYKPVHGGYPSKTQ
jgi:hypothetical protein